MLSILQPGTSPQTFAIFNLSLVALVAFSLYLYLSGVTNIHFLILSFLASELLVGVNYVVSVVGLENSAKSGPNIEDNKNK